jgi:tetratricopeptide (TPR) repeat protein
VFVRHYALLAVLSCCTATAQTSDTWTLTHNAHLEVYSHAGDNSARPAFLWFEQLRTFFQQNGILGAGFSDQNNVPLQVIGFGSVKEYEEYRLRPVADAYYVADGSHNYIVMATLAEKDFGVAAHEYTHYVLHANDMRLPRCLGEGLAEFFSTLHINGGDYDLGGDLPARTQTLRRDKWLPLSELLDIGGDESPLPVVRKRSEIFYAESWALANLLMTSPQYATRFRELVYALNAGSKGSDAIPKVYGVSLDELTKSLEASVGHARSARGGLTNPPESALVQSSRLSDRQARSLQALVSMVSGHLPQAQTRYENLSREEPDNPDFQAALGTIAFRQGNRDETLHRWQLAIGNHVADAELCYRYAVLAQDAGLDQQEVKAALERAVELAPAYDEARYKLALTESQLGEYKRAVEQLRAMRVPSGGRSYGYWIALASALTELDQRDEAKQAAHEALLAAQNEADRTTARRIAVIAATDVTVQFATDAEGHSQMVTTRVPHGTTEWNPFIEPSDRIQHSKGKLNKVLCTAGKLTGFSILTPEGSLIVEVPDPTHVLMRNSPDEFFCGPIQGKAVEADYAVVKASGKATNVLRGMKFE